MLLIARQYIYLDHAPMTASAAEHPATESYNKVMAPNTGSFKVIDSSLTTIMIDEDGILDTVLVDLATWGHRQKLQSFMTNTRQAMHWKMEVTKSTKLEIQLPQKNLLMRCKYRQSIALWNTWVEPVTFDTDTSCAGTATHQPTHFTIGAEWRKVTQGDNDMNEHKSEEKERYGRNRLWLGDSNVGHKISNSRQRLVGRLYNNL